MENTREAIHNGVLSALELLVTKQVRDANKPCMRLLVGRDGKPVFHTVCDRLGDIMRVYRAYPVPNRHRPKYDGADLRAIRAEKGIGRPPAKYIPVPEGATPQLASARDAVRKYGSQRKAAAAMGWSLGKLQRRLAKERGAA